MRGPSTAAGRWLSEPVPGRAPWPDGVTALTSPGKPVSQSPPTL